MALTKVRGNGLGTVNAADLDGAVTVNDSSADVDFRVESNGNANMLFVDGGNDKIGIGVNDPDATLDISGGSNKLGILRVVQRASGASAYGLDVGLDPSTGDPVFSRIVNDTVSESFRIERSTGNVIVGKTTTNINTQGIDLLESGRIQIVRAGPVLDVNRITSDGDVVRIRGQGTTEGTISVSGATVSYNGFSGLHESSGIETDTLIGTVVSTIDELDVYAPKQGEAGEEDNPKAGQTRKDHAKVKVSDTAGDKAVYGVVASFNAQGKVNVASVGIGSVRVTGACAKGDLLESNGDGTAKVQSDDIVRSKTIGKVTIGNSSTDEKLVSCVLYCG